MVPMNNFDQGNSAPAAEERIDETNNQNCQACDHNDTFDDMVQCDRCLTWWHFHCVGVNASISSQNWICRICIDSTNSHRSVSSSGSALQRLRERQELERQRVDIELRQKFLDEQYALINAEEFQSFQSRPSASASIIAADKRTKEWVESIHSDEGNSGKEPASSTTLSNEPLHIATSKELTELNHRLEQYQGKAITENRLVEFQQQLQQCQEMLAALSSMEHDAESTRMILTGKHCAKLTGATPKTVNVGNTVAKQPTDANEFAKRKAAPAAQIGVESTVPPFNCQAYPTMKQLAQNNRPTINNIYESGQLRQEPARPPYPNVMRNTRMSNQSRQPQAVHCSTTLPDPSWSRYAQPTNQPICHSQFPQSTSRVRIRSNQLNQHGNATSSDFMNAVQLTPQQLAARQSFARELPPFTGDPAEWPIFIGNFEYTTAVCGYTNGENMLRLQRSLKGYALETVRSRLVIPAAVPQVIEALRAKFGRPDFLINSLLQKVRAIPVQKSVKLEGLIEFGEAVQELCDHIEAANEHAHLYNPQLIQELIEKLPDDQKMKWAEYRRQFKDIDLRIFGDYMAIIARDASSVVSFKPYPRSANREKPNSKGFVNSHTELVEDYDPSDLQDQQKLKTVTCMFCNKIGHKLKECYKFKGLSVEERWTQVRLLNVCFCCLSSHGRRACRSGIRCNIQGCDYRHHPLLHSSNDNQKNTRQVAEIHTHRVLNSATIFRVIPVTLHGPSGSVETYAFLDEGSDLTLIENDIVEQLGLKGSLHPLCLRWTANTIRTEKKSRIVNLEISDVGLKKRFTIVNARTVNCLNLPTQNFNAEHAAAQNEHLRGIPIRSYTNAKPSLLIGIDNLRLAVPLKVREGMESSITAVKTRLGWCVYGTSSHEANVSHSFTSAKVPQTINFTN
ncbi:uncharacterized protein LOC129754139 [Uranotaenia lowii]|uniref:uncharacterized protein LOC129754139 n=1 Tax=Uranotaenia lowii TaxID=190385 RepID=UPI0024793B6E|nr:uncharacterized protein LOC129754139 [Uranotaenia lowii]XP_055605995.1 uncharacterized protein LOC129754139 [Uranotaenia lowii]XP_055605996.1 uncharacterized protein LOC129754139 [Uranotaenia lowii]